jgi:hypothetical protein
MITTDDTDRIHALNDAAQANSRSAFICSICIIGGWRQQPSLLREENSERRK